MYIFIPCVCRSDYSLYLCLLQLEHLQPAEVLLCTTSHSVLGEHQWICLRTAVLPPTYAAWGKKNTPNIHLINTVLSKTDIWFKKGNIIFGKWSLPLQRLPTDCVPRVFEFSQQIFQVLSVMAGLRSLMETPTSLQRSFVHWPLWPEHLLELLKTKQQISEIIHSFFSGCNYIVAYSTFCSVSCCLISSWDTAISLCVSNVCSTSVIQSSRRCQDSLNWNMTGRDIIEGLNIKVKIFDYYLLIGITFTFTCFALFLTSSSVLPRSEVHCCSFL